MKQEKVKTKNNSSSLMGLMKMKKRKSPYWFKGLIIGLIIGILTPTIIFIVNNLMNPNLIYSNGDWQCHDLEKSPHPCSFLKAVVSLIVFWIIYHIFLFIPTIVITLILATVGALIGYFISRNKKIRNKHIGYKNKK